MVAMTGDSTYVSKHLQFNFDKVIFCTIELAGQLGTNHQCHDYQGVLIIKVS